ncbi:MAG: invertase protein [Parcubacteria group bacterium GW2011_GWA2_52_8]|nr:MAG: invertase protein [Parcubacteria group bacterium GW2011_GWA2_52_8]
MTDETQNAAKLIVVYGRVSTSNQENEGTIETQLSAVREFAQKNNYTIVQEYLDDGWSGDSIVRPALDQLRMDAKKKIWEGVLMYDPDRLARRYSYQELVMDELREAGIEVIFVTVSAPKNSEDKILHGVRGLFAEYERAKITERFRLGKIRKVKEGHVLTTEAPYGYTYIRKQEGKHGYYEINPTEAKIVKMIFSWVANDGLTIRKVVRKLQELAIKPQRSKRGVWSTSTLTTLLRNKAYIGEAHWGSSYSVVPEKPLKVQQYKKIKKTSRRMKPEEEWIASKIPVPVIIDRELFSRVREQLKTNFALCDRNKKNQYLLAGKIKCICGRTRGGEGPQHGKHLYYRCNDRNYSFPLSPTCAQKGINARITDKLVWDKIAGLMSSPELLAKQVERWMSTKRAKAKSSFGDIAIVEKEISKLKDQEERYNKAYGAALFTIEKLKEYTDPIRARMAALESQIIKAGQEADRINVDLLPTKTETKIFTREAGKALKNLNFETRRAIVLNTVEKVVGTQQQLQVSGYIPLTLNHVEYKTSYRYCWASQRR